MTIMAKNECMSTTEGSMLVQGGVEKKKRVGGTDENAEESLRRGAQFVIGVL